MPQTPISQPALVYSTPRIHNIHGCVHGRPMGHRRVETRNMSRNTNRHDGSPHSSGSSGRGRSSALLRESSSETQVIDVPGGRVQGCVLWGVRFLLSPGYFPGITRTPHFCNFCKTFIAIPCSFVTSVSIPGPRPTVRYVLYKMFILTRSAGIPLSE